MRRLAIISFHTSPLVQPGVGEGGGMNVYVKQLSSALARIGTVCDVYTRAYSSDLPAMVSVEPGFRVHHIPAGPLSEVSKSKLLDYVDEFEGNLLTRLSIDDTLLPDAIHANYWLSGIVGHKLKHAFEIPLITTFHTLEKVKAKDRAVPDDDISETIRIEQEEQIINCSDAVLASCGVEADEISELYGLERGRISIVPLGVDHAFFSPGDREMARKATGLPTDGRMMLFVGRIQPLKGADIALDTFIRLAKRIPDIFLVMIGGPSGPFGERVMRDIEAKVERNKLSSRVYFVPPQRHEVLSSYYRAADVGIVPSRTESFGLVALEAAACGLPVVASNVGGLKTLVNHGVSGYLVKDRSANDFEKFAEKVLDNPRQAKSLEFEARSLSASYTWRDAALRLRKVLDDLTARNLVECS